MGTPYFIARQLAHPRGLLGRIIGWLMNRHNARINAGAVRALELQVSDRVLEIGFGGGVSLKPLLDAAAYVAGVDRSRGMVRRAHSNFSAAVSEGRADFREGDVEALPFGTGSFGKACTVNTIYFWKSLEAGFAEIRRVLSPNGRLVVGFLPKDGMERLGVPQDIFALREPAEVVSALMSAGFKNVRVERPVPATPWRVVIAVN
jgi:arsenite methyltransferase